MFDFPPGDTLSVTLYGSSSIDTVNTYNGKEYVLYGRVTQKCRTSIFRNLSVCSNYMFDENASRK